MLKRNTPLIVTSRYHNAAAIKASGLIAVAASLGTPKWEVGYQLVRDSAVRKLLAPWGLLHLKLPEDEFRDRYLERLQKHGVDKILSAIEQLGREHDRAGIAVLCWEDVKKPDTWCHRTIFGAWWEEQTGGKVPEL